jgi:Cytochrome c554 and c-prime
MKQFAGLLLVLCVLAGSVGPSPAQEPDTASSAAVSWRFDRQPGSYVGSAVCAECHAGIAKSQLSTPMAHSLTSAGDSAILQVHPRLVFQSGRFSYLIARQGNQSVYSVTDGMQSISAPVQWAFGHGLSSQTYVLSHDGEYYESRVSFYTAIDGLDYTLGHPREPAASLTEAFGRKLEPDEPRKCIACHSTGAVKGNEMHPDKLEGGVRCEACHGPGAKHVAAMRKGQSEREIFNPNRMSPDSLTQELCGSCHRSVDDVYRLPNRGDIHNIRFQPYRLFSSKCYSDDRRISCAACHDPHTALQHDVSYYDQKCQACHSRKDTTTNQEEGTGSTYGLIDIPLCSVRQQDCVTCHMPKFGLPGSHFDFTDHRIRIYKLGMPFPI